MKVRISRKGVLYDMPYGITSVPDIDILNVFVIGLWDNTAHNLAKQLSEKESAEVTIILNDDKSKGILFKDTSTAFEILYKSYISIR